MGRLSMVMIAVGVSMVAVIALALLLPDMGERILHVLMPHASIVVMTLALALAMLLLCSWSSAEIVPPGTEVVMSSADDAASSHYIYDSVNSDGHPRNMGENKHFPLSLSPEVENLLLPIEFSDFPPLVPSEAPDDFIRILSIRERLRNVARTIDLMDDMRLSPAVEDILLPLEFSDCPPLVPWSPDDADAILAELMPRARKKVKAISMDDAVPESFAPAGDTVAFGDDLTTDPVAIASSDESYVSTSGDSFDDFLSGLSEEEAAFWSSFFVEGEDEITLADGLYYMDLYINDRVVGEISVSVTDEIVSLSARELRGYVEDTLTDEAVSRIFLGKGELISLDELRASGVSAECDPLLYEISLGFGISDMPVQVLSISGSGRRLSSRPIAGALEIDPAVFALSTRYTLSGSFNVTPFESFTDSLRIDFGTYNIARLYDLYARFSYSFRYSRGLLGFELGSYDFYIDLQEQMIRLRWGNISTELLSPSGTVVGFRFDKSLSYGGAGVRGKSHIERILTVEKESEVQILNEGREIFKRTLQPGNYRLQDFILYTGANRIRIIVTPLDGSPVMETDIDISYASSLLAPGEVYYGGAVATGRTIVDNSSSKRAGAVRLPLWSGKSLEYDARNIVLSGYIRAGLTESLTLDTSLAVQNRVTSDSPYSPVAEAAFEFTHANVLGTTRYNLNITERSDRWGAFEIPELYLRISHQIYTDWNPISALNFSFTYDSNMAYDLDRHSFSLSLNTSGSIYRMSWGLGTSVTLDTDDIANPRYYISGSLSYSFSNNLYMSASLSLDGYGAEIPSLTGRISATLRFNPVRINASVSESSTALSVGYNDSRNSFTAELETPTSDILAPRSYSLDADYSYSGKYFNVNVGADAASLMESSAISFSVSTASVFADGLVGFSSSIPSNFILVKQEGALKGNDLTIGAVGISSANTVPTVFNTGLYTGLSLDYGSSLTVFSVNDESFGSASAFDVAIPPSQRGGYTLRVSAESKYSLSGVVMLPSGLPWINGSSPVYRITRTEEGMVLENSEYYLFADSDGRFILSDMVPGEYGFDVNTEDGWLLYTFTVIDSEEHVLDINVLGEAVAAAPEILPYPYIGHYVFEQGSFITGDAFWTALYPEWKEAV